MHAVRDAIIARVFRREKAGEGNKITAVYQDGSWVFAQLCFPFATRAPRAALPYSPATGAGGWKSDLLSQRWKRSTHGAGHAPVSRPSRAKLLRIRGFARLFKTKRGPPPLFSRGTTTLGLGARAEWDRVRVLILAWPVAGGRAKERGQPRTPCKKSRPQPFNPNTMPLWMDGEGAA